MLRAILIDDDQSNLSALSEKLLKHCPHVQVIGRCDNGEDGINGNEWICNVAATEVQKF